MTTRTKRQPAAKPPTEETKATAAATAAKVEGDAESNQVESTDAPVAAKAEQSVPSTVETRPDDAEPGIFVGGANRIHVKARRDGFRRAGRAWPAAGVELDIADLSEEQLEAISNEPMLIVMPIVEPSE